MKKLFKNLLFFSVIGSAAFLYSCGGDDEPVLPDAPSLDVTTTVNGSAVTGTDIDAVLGDVIVMDITANTPGGFNVVRISGDVDADDITRTDLGLAAGATSGEVEFTLELADEALIGTDVEVVIEVVDDADQTATVTYTISVSAPPSPEARAYTAVLLAAPTGDRTSETFFSTSTGVTYTANGVISGAAGTSANIDFGYYYGTSNMASLAAPASFPSTIYNLGAGGQGWGTLNATMLRSTTLGASAFGTEGVSTWADIDEAFEAGTDEAGVKTQLTVGTVLAFATDSGKTGGSKKGLILVKSITGTSGSDGRIELEILVQEEVEG